MIPETLLQCISFITSFKIEGVVDNSGLRLWVIPDPPQYEAATLEIGVSLSVPLHFIPPGQESFTSSGHCMPECLGLIMEQENIDEITIFAVMLHTHLAGIRARIRHYREGKELPLVIQDNHYDFNFQETRPLAQDVIVKRGDGLLLECDYSTTDRDTVVFSGVETRDEMCVAYLIYYPRLPLSNCDSNPTLEQTFKFISAEAHESSPYLLAGPVEYRDWYVWDVATAIDWTPDMVQGLQQSISTGPVNVRCNNGRHSKYLIYSDEYMSTTLEPYRDITDDFCFDPVNGSNKDIFSVFLLLTATFCVLVQYHHG